MTPGNDMLAEHDPQELAVMRAAALVWLDMRARLLSELSVHSDGGWANMVFAEGPDVLVSLAQQMKGLAEVLDDEAGVDHASDLICAVLDEQARLNGYTREIAFREAR